MFISKTPNGIVKVFLEKKFNKKVNIIKLK